MIMSIFLSVEEAASFLKTTPKYIYKLVHLRLLPCYKPTGGRLFFDQQELEEFIRKRRKATQDEISERAIHMINQRGLK